jgi:TetR/AcrR family transcriptional regulator of autoinduction and epiphytic fitness
MKKNRPLNEKKREAIISASIDEFYAKGYEGSSMDTIAKKANVSKATVYNHFKNKEELFLAIAYMLKDRFKNNLDYKYSKELDIKVQLKELATKEMSFLSNSENMTLIQIVTIVMIQKNGIGKKLLEETKDNSIANISKWFDDAKLDNKLEFDDSEFVTKHLVGLIKSFAFYPQLYGAPILTKTEQEDIIDKTVDSILKIYSKK